MGMYRASVVCPINFRKKYPKILFSDTVFEIKAVLCIYVHNVSIYMNCVLFYSSWIRTLAAMATPAFHGLIMGKMKSVCSICRY